VSRTRARVTVRLKPAILDPQGRAVQATLQRLGHDRIDELRIGKIVEFTVAGTPDEAEPTVRRIAEEVLANPVMEDVEIALEPAAEAPAEG
jgi:phosphoribosylformylglycinamidine synthase